MVLMAILFFLATANAREIDYENAHQERRLESVKIDEKLPSTANSTKQPGAAPR